MTTRSNRRSFLLLVLAGLAGCASVPMAPPERDAASKTFAAPAAGRSGLYVYRVDTVFGASLEKTLWLDGVTIGETAAGVYFHREIDPGEHTLATESEFGNNELQFTAVPGQNHFFEQYLKWGFFVGGANLRAVSEQEGKKAVLDCGEALGVTAAEPAKTPQG